MKYKTVKHSNNFAWMKSYCLLSFGLETCVNEKKDCELGADEEQITIMALIYYRVNKINDSEVIAK